MVPTDGGSLRPARPSARPEPRARRISATACDRGGITSPTPECAPVSGAPFCSSSDCSRRSTRQDPSPARRPTPCRASHSRSSQASVRRSTSRGPGCNSCQALTRSSAGSAGPKPPVSSTPLKRRPRGNPLRAFPGRRAPERGTGTPVPAPRSPGLPVPEPPAPPRHRSDAAGNARRGSPRFPPRRARAPCPRTRDAGAGRSFTSAHQPTSWRSTYCMMPPLR